MVVLTSIWWWPCSHGTWYSFRILGLVFYYSRVEAFSSLTLYDVGVMMGNDAVASYPGLLPIEKREVDGVARALLNGSSFTVMFGTLDQGFSPDGIYTPNREAMVYDFQALKGLGFNMVRKHVSKSSCHFPTFTFVV
jgi:hypothetical protein